MPRHSCCEVRVMQLHDILLLRTSESLHSVSVGAKPLSTGQCAPCRRLYQLGDGLPPLIPACFSPPIEMGVISQLIYSFIIMLHLVVLSYMLLRILLIFFLLLHSDFPAHQSGPSHIDLHADSDLFQVANNSFASRTNLFVRD